MFQNYSQPEWNIQMLLLPNITMIIVKAFFTSIVATRARGLHLEDSESGMDEPNLFNPPPPR